MFNINKVTIERDYESKKDEGMWQNPFAAPAPAPVSVPASSRPKVSQSSISASNQSLKQGNLDEELEHAVCSYAVCFLYMRTWIQVVLSSMWYKSVSVMFVCRSLCEQWTRGAQLVRTSLHLYIHRHLLLPWVLREEKVSEVWCEKQLLILPFHIECTICTNFKLETRF